MELVQVRSKGQVTILNRLRQQAGLHIGDLLAAEFIGGVITLTPLNPIDRRLAESLEQYRQGKGSQIFPNVDAAINFLHEQVKRGGKKSKRT